MSGFPWFLRQFFHATADATEDSGFGLIHAGDTHAEPLGDIDGAIPIDRAVPKGLPRFCIGVRFYDSQDLGRQLLVEPEFRDRLFEIRIRLGCGLLRKRRSILQFAQRRRSSAGLRGSRFLSIDVANSVPRNRRQPGTKAGLVFLSREA